MADATVATYRQLPECYSYMCISRHTMVQNSETVPLKSNSDL